MDEQAHSEARHRLPPLNALRHFEAVARGGSFAAAALELHVTHWAVGKQIRVLEDWFGVPLFKRLARGVALTDDGAALLSDVTGAFSRLAAGAARLRHEESGPRLSGVVRVNVMPSFAACWLLPRLGDFHARYPGIDVRVSTTSRKLRYVGDAFDVGVRSGTEDGPGWMSRPLMADLRLPACSPSVLRQRPLRCAADLGMHTLLHSATTRADWSHWLRQAGAGDVRVTHQVEYDHVFLQLTAAVEGLGVALASLPLIERELASGRLVCPLSGPAWRAPDYALVVKRESTPDGAVVAFEKWITAMAAPVSGEAS